MQPRRGLVQNVQCASGLALRKFSCELDSLCLATGKGGGRLAKLNIAEPDLHNRRELLLNLWNIFEQLQCIHRLHVQNVADRMALEAHCKCFGVVAPPPAHRSEERRVGKECRSRWSP